jgi:uncharacterized protein (DUF58 family)
MAEQLLDQDTINRLEQLSLISRKISTGRLRGERRSRRRGSSADFADYRNYVPGDDLRFLDWKIYGRLERLFIKLFLEEEDLRINILIDTSPSMRFGEPDKLLYAKRVAAALGYICLTRMDSLTVKTFGDRLIESYGPKRGKVNSRNYFDFLSSIVPSEKTSLQKSFRTFSHMTGSKGMAIVISDFYDFDGYEEALRQLFARNFEILAIHVLSPEEMQPGYQGDIRLLDCEFDASTDVSMGKSIMDVYQSTMAAFCNGLKSYIVGRGGSYLLASTDSPFERLVFDVLRRRGIVR